MRGISLFLLICLFKSFSTSAVAADLSVLFLGNSYTGQDNVPGIFQSIGSSAGVDVEVASNTPGGATLSVHFFSETSLSLINQQAWDFVVLQEQSVVPADDGLAGIHLFPHAANLNALITDRGSETALYMTWGRRDGYTATNFGVTFAFPDYESMQAVITANYTRAAKENDAVLAPVGIAWKNVRASHPAISLYDGDGSHPSVNGAYLAALTIYCALTGTPVTGSSYFPPGVTSADAAILQQAATEAVLPVSASNEWWTME